MVLTTDYTGTGCGNFITTHQLCLAHGLRLSWAWQFSCVNLIEGCNYSQDLSLYCALSRYCIQVCKYKISKIIKHNKSNQKSTFILCVTFSELIANSIHLCTSPTQNSNWKPVLKISVASRLKNLSRVIQP